MLRPRIIPCLLIRNRGLVKTVRFQDEKYVGDPINAVRIFNEKEADEIIVLDIDATRERREPDYRTIERLAAECRMPLCYGGGIKTSDQASRILGLGVEKIAVSSSAIDRPEFVSEMATRMGSQSVVTVLDVKRDAKSGQPHVFVENGRRNTGKCPIELSQVLEGMGAGEVVINSIDADGTMKGYDIDLLVKIRARTSVVVTALGGAGTLQHISDLIEKCGLVGAAAGSLFVFKGLLRAVLINYPDSVEKESLARRALSAGKA